MPLPIMPLPTPESEDRLPDGISQPKDSDTQLQEFLASVANTPLKVKILHLFFFSPGLMKSSQQVAHLIEAPETEVRRAALQLCEDRAFSYCPSFGLSDLCHLSPQYYSPHSRESLKLLERALQHQPQQVWDYVEALPQTCVPKAA